MEILRAIDRLDAARCAGCGPRRARRSGAMA
jgi:hypothetical protein